MIDQTFQVKNTTAIGRFGEKIAENYLINKGYRLLKRNYYIRGGELDLIMEKDGIISFVEVKLRTGKSFGLGSEAFSSSKKQKLLRAIFIFLETLQKPHDWQLDLVNILYDKKLRVASVQHFSNILEL